MKIHSPIGKILPFCSIAFATLVSSVLYAQQDTQQVEARVKRWISAMGSTLQELVNLLEAARGRGAGRPRRELTSLHNRKAYNMKRFLGAMSLLLSLSFPCAGKVLAQGDHYRFVMVSHIGSDPNMKRCSR
jgi:hypothetical protein